jgi:hypothetical protein
MNRTISLAIASLAFLFAPLFAGATQTVAPTGAYVPTQNTDTQHVNITAGGNTIKADNSGVDINIPGMASIKANNSGADINVNANGQNMQVSGNSNGTANIQMNGGAVSVHTDSDLAAYAANVRASNSAITAIHTSSAEVQVSYNESVKLFGFLPMSLSNTVNVDAKGSVNIDQPWYSMFVGSTAGAVKAKLTSDLSAVVGTSGQLDAGTQAQVVAKINNDISL